MTRGVELSSRVFNCIYEIHQLPSYRVSFPARKRYINQTNSHPPFPHSSIKKNMSKDYEIQVPQDNRNNARYLATHPPS
jgi:hypothetical protein